MVRSTGASGEFLSASIATTVGSLATISTASPVTAAQHNDICPPSVGYYSAQNPSNCNEYFVTDCVTGMELEILCIEGHFDVSAGSCVPGSSCIGT